MMTKKMSLLLTGMLLCLAPDMKGNETAIEAKAITRDVVKRINKRMKLIGEELGIGNITTYTARHSYATVLKRSGVNISYISESLGHTD